MDCTGRSAVAALFGTVLQVRVASYLRLYLVSAPPTPCSLPMSPSHVDTPAGVGEGACKPGLTDFQTKSPLNDDPGKEDSSTPHTHTHLSGAQRTLSTYQRLSQLVVIAMSSVEMVIRRSMVPAFELENFFPSRPNKHTQVPPPPTPIIS